MISVSKPPNTVFNWGLIMAKAISSPALIFSHSNHFITFLPHTAVHRGSVSVFHIPGELLEWDGFPDLMDDLALTWLLGMKIVIVVGCRHQVDRRLENFPPSDFEFDRSNIGIPVRPTDPETLKVVEEEAGYVRYEVERLLHRSLHLHGGGYEVNDGDAPPAPNGNVVSGNSFFSARPIGFMGGIDYQRAGYPSRVNTRKILQTIANHDVVLLTPIGVSPSGEILNVDSESLASFVAGSLSADKIVFCAAKSAILRDRISKRPVQNFRLRDAKNILEFFNLEVNRDLFVTLTRGEGWEAEGGNSGQRLSPAAVDILFKIGWAARALEEDGAGLRAHIVAPADGALLTELFTSGEGTGTCISQDWYESIHPDDDPGDLNNVDWIRPQNPVRALAALIDKTPRQMN